MVARVDPVDRAQELAAPGADEPADPDHLARADLEADVAHVRQAGDVADGQDGFAVALGPLGVELPDLASDHQLDELVRRRRRREPGRDRAAVGEDGDAVAEAADLVEAVRDVDHADALRSEPADDAEHRLDLVVVEDRGRLVHDQQAHVARERAGDRDDLLTGRAQVPDVGPRRDPLVVEALQDLSGVAAHPVDLEQPRPPRLVAQEDVLGDGQVLDEVELLVDRRHPAVERAAGVALGKRCAADQDLARARLDGPGDALDQSRLAGAVRADHAVHLALAHVEVDSLERLDPGVLLRQPAHLEHRAGRGRRRHRTTSGLRLRCASSRPASTRSGLPPQTGSSCSTDRNPSKPPS